jgi:hypothetical protein
MEKEKREIAFELVKMGLSVEKIVEVTELNVTEVKKLFER